MDLDSASSSDDFDVLGFSFPAAREETRPPRRVRVGLAQNRIVLPTTESVSAQREALFAKIGGMVEAAGRGGVNVLCLQELWSERIIEKNVEKLYLPICNYSYE